MDEEEEKRLETTKNVLLIKTAVYAFIIVFVITIIVRLAGQIVMMDEEERIRLQSRRLKNAIMLVGAFAFLGLLSGAQAYVYLICLPIAAICGYFGTRNQDLELQR